MKLFEEWWYVLIYGAVMLCVGLLKQNNIYTRLINWLNDRVPSNWMVFIASSIGGILPIPGRIVYTAGLIDGVISKDEYTRKKVGPLNYLASHHYYLWSPLEKTVLLPILLLNLTYIEVLTYTLPLLLCTFISILFMVNRLKTLSDYIGYTVSSHEHKKKWYEHIDFKGMLLILGIIVFGNFIKGYHEQIKSAIGFLVSENFSLLLVSIVSFLGAFMLGSSSKFIGFVVLLTQYYGLEYFTYFFALEYAGYLLSPNHKCLAIGVEYFKTPITQFYRVIGAVAALLIGVGAITLF